MKPHKTGRPAAIVVRPPHDGRDSRPSISAVIPAYNEQDVIGSTVGAVREALDELTPDYEIVVVNDGSRDRTEAIVADLGRAHPEVRCVSHPENRGYGAALWTGFGAATRELIFLTDGDRQFNPRELAGFVPLLAEADLVIGCREPRRDPPIRCLNGWGWNLLVRLLFGYTARDADCAFKLFRRSILDGLQVRATGSAFSAEFLVKARRLGYRIVERPVSHYPRPAGRATGAHPAVIARAFRELVRLRADLAVSARGETIPAAYEPR